MGRKIKAFQPLWWLNF
uniref:Uncharacterized protein n=1 Tax=Anguilla anguilla TaxID=7936 RepID=A0A0E9XPV1_ANGAN